MASTECVVRYGTGPAKLAKALAAVLLPIYLVPVVSLILLISVFVLTKGQGGFSGVEFVSGNPTSLLVFLFLSIFPAIGFASLSLDDRLILSPDGLTIPLRMSLLIGFKRKLFWDEISSVGFFGNVLDEKGGSLLFRFGEGQSIRLALDGFEPREVSSLLIALNACLPKKAIEELEPLNAYLSQKQLVETDGDSLVELWDRELANRFHPTVFVPLEIGATLSGGRFKVVRQLAFGGMAAIYLAQKDGASLMILKEAVLPADADDAVRARMVEMFEREAHLLTRVRHRRIAAVHDYFIENARHYLVLDYISGRNLRQIVFEQGLPEIADVERWFKQLVEILNYLHELNPPIVHRDVTPENIIIDDNGDAILIDFGAANDSLGNATGTIVGKHRYMAPEQFRGKAERRSDIYSLGCTVHFLLTGVDPVVFSQCRPATMKEDIPASLDNLVARMTEQNPADRPESALAIIIEAPSLNE